MTPSTAELRRLIHCAIDSQWCYYSGDVVIDNETFWTPVLALFDSLEKIKMNNIQVIRNERGSWCVYIDGKFISDHATHTAARLTAKMHADILSKENR
jgi:hypothetical protein